MTFRDLRIGQGFTFHSEGYLTYRSFHTVCHKISPRKYTDGTFDYEVETINVVVYPVKPEPRK
jgi:hypothetical protein